MSPARIDWITENAKLLGATVVRGSLENLIRTSTASEIHIEQTYQPIYREAIEKSVRILSFYVFPFPSVSPDFGKRYSARFFGYFARIGWGKL